MLQRATAFILIFMILTVGFSRLFVYAGFAINQKYIATTLCINKTKPVLKCKGKCYLAKKLKQAEEKEKSQKRTSQENILQEGFISEKLTIHYPSTCIHINYPNLLTRALAKRSFSVFHPPKA